MNKSEYISELAMALSHLQGELEDVYKGTPGHGYQYSTLTDVLKMVRPLLCKHKLSITQMLGGEGGSISLTTVLMHASGAFIESTVSVPVDTSNKRINFLQSCGSAATYLRRYSIMGVLGISSTDDDGASFCEQKTQLKQVILDQLLNGSLTKEQMDKALTRYQASSVESLSVQQLQLIVSAIAKNNQSVPE